MQIAEVPEQHIIRLTAVDHRTSSNDMRFLETVVNELKPHDFLEFKKTHPVVYQRNNSTGKNRTRPAIDFETPTRKIITLEATDHADFKVRKGFQEISLHITRGNPFQIDPKIRRGIFVYGFSRITNDPRHHLNGPYVDVCFEFCDYCFEMPIIDRMQVGLKMCIDCRKLPLKRLLDMREYRQSIQSKSQDRFKRAFGRIREFIKI